jgi:hypothetical protein
MQNKKTNNMKKLICADNVISVTFNKEYANDYFQWIPVTKYLKRKYFWSPKKIEVTGGGYYRGFGYMESDEFLEYLSKHYGGRYKFKIDNVLNEGPFGTLYNKASIHIKSIGGKYTEDHIMYYDTDEEALEEMESIEKQFPGKFLIVK